MIGMSDDILHFLTLPTPVGEVLVAWRGDALVTLHPLHEPAEPELDRLAHRFGPLEPGAEHPLGRRAAEQLEEYFARKRRVFDLPLDLDGVRGFARAALEAIREIPYGETAGYGEVAIAAGSPGAARAVGTACATTPFSIVIPVHRVVRADGSLGEYGGHPEVKRYLVALERAAGE
jgi:methylated-DNA-[protein]-cysteine S-methyltransferase